MKSYQEYSIDCTGDVCVGDEIVFTEAVFKGKYPKGKISHARTICGEVVRDSYGADKQQHTFSIRVLGVRGDGASFKVIPGKIILRKGRNVYRHGTRRKPWDDENHRVSILDEKHRRGKQARKERDRRECIQILGDVIEEML